MGVLTLYTFLEEAKTSISVQALSGEKIAFDVSEWLIHFNVRQSRFSIGDYRRDLLCFFVERLLLIYSFGIKPMLVFEEPSVSKKFKLRHMKSLPERGGSSKGQNGKKATVFSAPLYGVDRGSSVRQKKRNADFDDNSEEEVWSEEEEEEVEWGGEGERVVDKGKEDGEGGTVRESGRESAAKRFICASFDDIAELLDVLGVPYAVSPGESDGLMSYLQKKGIVDAVMSEDGDLLMYGARKLFRNLFGAHKMNSGKQIFYKDNSGVHSGTKKKKEQEVDIYELDNIEKVLDFGRERLVFMACLMGNDYFKGFQGIGQAKASSIAEAFHSEGDDLRKSFSAYLDWVFAPEKDQQANLFRIPGIVRKSMRRQLHDSREQYEDSVEKYVFGVYLKDFEVSEETPVEYKGRKITRGIDLSASVAWKEPSVVEVDNFCRKNNLMKAERIRTYVQKRLEKYRNATKEKQLMMTDFYKTVRDGGSRRAKAKSLKAKGKRRMEGGQSAASNQEPLITGADAFANTRDVNGKLQRNAKKSAYQILSEMMEEGRPEDLPPDSQKRTQPGDFDSKNSYKSRKESPIVETQGGSSPSDAFELLDCDYDLSVEPEDEDVRGTRAAKTQGIPLDSVIVIDTGDEYEPLNYRSRTGSDSSVIDLC